MDSMVFLSGKFQLNHDAVYYVSNIVKCIFYYTEGLEMAHKT